MRENGGWIPDLSYDWGFSTISIKPESINSHETEGPVRREPHTDAQDAADRQAEDSFQRPTGSFGQGVSLDM